MTDICLEQLSSIDGGNGYSKDFIEGVIIGYQAAAIVIALIGVFAL